jgi:hypothetical protein
VGTGVAVRVGDDVAVGVEVGVAVGGCGVAVGGTGVAIDSGDGNSAIGVGVLHAVGSTSTINTISQRDRESMITLLILRPA